MQNSDQITEAARRWLGTRWRHQGRTREAGVDCCGLVILVAKELGLSDYDTTDYARRTTGDQFYHHFITAGMVGIPKDLYRPGDVVLTHDESFPCHCGFVTEKRGELQFLHAHARRRQVVEEPIKFWTPQISHALRFP